MLDYISYFLFFSILIIFTIYLYIRLKYGFWISQPVFHIYDVSYIFNPPGIITLSLPEKNKYINFKDIETCNFSQLSSIQKTRFFNLIKTSYLQNGDNIFSPQPENITPYFIGHNDTSLITFFYKDYNMFDTKNGKIVTDNLMTGVITSRPINIVINNDRRTNNKSVKLRAYYVDYLCVDKLNRKKGIAPQLIQTHYYNQRLLNKNIVVSLFKREDELTGIVPLCVYSTYGFDVDKWTKPAELSGPYKLLEINGSNYRFLYDFINYHSREFNIIISTDMANILELIKTKNIYIYVILCDEQILCCYYFRKTCVQIEKGLEALTFFASICNCEHNIFIQGFKISFWKIAAENFFGFAVLENLSHNNIIIDNILLKNTPKIVSPTAYFFYNFAYPTFQSNKTFIVN